jgi:hypothetical protein
MPASFLIGRAPDGSDVPVKVDEDGNFVIAIDGDVEVNADLGILEASVAAIDAKLPELVDGNQPVLPVGVADLGNSTTANLNGGASFVGTGIEASPKYGTISVCIISSHDSATDGLKFQVSIDNVNWENIEQYNYVAVNGLKSYSFSPSGKYFRVNYTNGATTTTKLAIFTVLRSGAVKASSHRIKDNIDGEHDAELVKAVLAAEMPSGTFTDINATAGGNLKISLEEVNGIDPLPTTVPARTPTTTSVASSASSVTILAANASRRGVSIANDSTATLRLSFSNPATSADAFIVLSPGAFILLDQQLIVANAIYGIWTAANGTAQVTEYV